MQSRPLKKMVLCIDDEEAILTMLRATLEAYGYLVLVSSSGSEALYLAATFPLDAVVVDCLMREKNGIEIAADLKRIKPNVPIILYTGKAPARISPRAIELVDAVVAKDDGTQALLTALGRALNAPPTGTPSSRLFPRFTVRWPFRVMADRVGETATLQGIATTVGEGGMGGKLEGPLLPGEAVVIQLSDPQMNVFLASQAQVCYRNGDSYGFKFLNVTPTQQAHVRRLCQRAASG